MLCGCTRISFNCNKTFDCMFISTSWKCLDVHRYSSLFFNMYNHSGFHNVYKGWGNTVRLSGVWFRQKIFFPYNLGCGIFLQQSTAYTNCKQVDNHCTDSQQEDSLVLASTKTQLSIRKSWNQGLLEWYLEEVSLYPCPALILFISIDTGADGPFIWLTLYDVEM